MAEEKDTCAGPGCRKVVHQPDQWAILDQKLFCCQRCYMRYVKRNYPLAYETLAPHLGAVD